MKRKCIAIPNSCMIGILLRFSAWIMAGLITFIMIGCAGDGGQDTTPPQVINVDARECNIIIIATFHEKMKKATIAVEDVSGTTILDSTGTIAIWAGIIPPNKNYKWTIEDENGKIIPPQMYDIDMRTYDTIIIATFSEKMEEAAIVVENVSGTTILDSTGTIAIWTNTIPSGDYNLTIKGKDLADNDLLAFSQSNFKGSSDTTPPMIVNSDCFPKNGSIGVASDGVTDIEIVFSELMSVATLESFEPMDAKIKAEFDGNKTLTISFIDGYKLDKGIKVKAILAGKDKAGNELATKVYSFTTFEGG